MSETINPNGDYWCQKRDSKTPDDPTLNFILYASKIDPDSLQTSSNEVDISMLNLEEKKALAVSMGLLSEICGIKSISIGHFLALLDQFPDRDCLTLNPILKKIGKSS